MFENKMLVCDMDGTLLNSSHDISAENLSAIEYFTGNGGIFTVATGRNQYSAARYIRQLPVNIPVILFNGAMIYDYDKTQVLWKNPISPNAAETVKEVMAKFPGAGIEIHRENEIYLIAGNEFTDVHLKKDNNCAGTFQVETVPLPWLKVLIAWDNVKLLEIENYLKQKALPFRFTFSSDIYLEFLDFNSSKGHALEYLSDFTGIDMQNIYAAGDNMNDLEMIMTAGTGMAVANGHPALLQSADLILPNNNENAVASAVKWIEKQIRLSSVKL
ncbi:MAG: HAD family phosphatase [Spirochaetes bacterium]|nr:HAD family phosphatase [Spirochaetota bacterium]